MSPRDHQIEKQNFGEVTKMNDNQFNALKFLSGIEDEDSLETMLERAGKMASEFFNAIPQLKSESFEWKVEYMTKPDDIMKVCKIVNGESTACLLFHCNSSKCETDAPDDPDIKKLGTYLLLGELLG